MEQLERMLPFSFEQIPLVAAALIIAFTVHEFAHAYTAYKFGDSTAKDQGRLTLNPLQHLDPFGALLIFLVGFGWARPVPVNRFRLKNPRLGGVLVSLMGPVSNLLLAMLGYAVVFVFIKTGWAATLPEFVFEFFNLFIWLNVMLFVFNLIPLPPLDGYRIVEDLVPPSVRPKLTGLEQYGALIFLVLVLVPPLNRVTISPLLNTVVPLVLEGLQGIFSRFL